MKVFFTVFISLFITCQIFGQWDYYECSSDEIVCVPSSGETYTLYASCACGIAGCPLTDSFDDCDGRNFHSAYILPIVASGNSITISTVWEPLNCYDADGGFYLGLMENCDNSCLGSSNNCDNTGQAVSLSVDELVIGRVYYLYMAGCTAGIDLDGLFNVDVSFSGDDTVDEDIIDFYFETNSGCATPYCGDEDLTVLLDVIDGFYTNDVEYHINIFGPENYLIVEEESEFVLESDVYQFLAGEYEICVTKVVSECNEILLNDCSSFIVTSSDDIITELGVCSGELRDGFGEDILGFTVSDEGEYTSELESCECGNEIFVISEIEEVEEFVNLQLCPEDFPFIYFDEYEFEFSQNGYEVALIIENGSTQLDYRGLGCDSLVYLVIENTQCAGCDLPVSLLDSELVICLPFENNAFDVSGNDNTINAFNLDYEDFIIDGSRTYSADFNGREDYVEIPHTDELDSPIFSFSFEFDKYKGFRNGPVETLISMGSGNQKRFHVDLVQTISDSFDLVGTFYTESDIVDVRAEGLFIDVEYDMAIVVSGNLVQLYIDGEIVDEVITTFPLNINQDNILLGVESAGLDMSQFYEGYVNDFKYWAQILNGRDILFLHHPEAEFIESIDIPLTCCDQFMVNDSLLLDMSNPTQEVIVPEASVTGYDSTYIYNFIADDPAPTVNSSLIPQDINIDYQLECDELCSMTVTWDVDPQRVFSDNCQELVYDQSHFSPLQIDQNNPEIEVVYGATDICGNRSEFSFIVELNCIEPAETIIADNSSIMLQVDQECVDDNSSICINAELEISPIYVDDNANTNLYSDFDSENLEFIFSINGQSQIFSFENQSSFRPEFTVAGTYDVCLESISDDCITKFIGVCETLTFYDNQSEDYGLFYACEDNYLSVLPSSISDELRNSINSNEGIFSNISADACGCSYSETIELKKVTTTLPVPLTIELCENESIMILGQEFSYDDNYNADVITFENATILSDSNGEKCDSLIELTIVKLEASSEEEYVDICEGEEYNGFTESGTYGRSFSSGAANGCDSLYTLHLSVLKHSILELAEAICPGDTLLGYSTAGLYSITYLAANGCDSVVTLDLTILEPQDPQCISTSVQGAELSQFKIFPNPASGQLYILSSNEVLGAPKDITIYSHNGQIVSKMDNYRDSIINISELESGLYIMTIKDGKDQSKFKFIKL
jgi:hypothetical protein